MTDTVLPQRPLQHEIDTEACKIVSSKFDRNWEVRDITGRDFGIDKIAERFQNGYATSELLLLQIKGTENPIDMHNPRFSLETKELQYSEMFSDPVLLIYVSIENPSQCYYVWLQEYIRVRLNFDNPNWREQATNTIYFPPNNLLDFSVNEKHLKFISTYPKFKNAWIQYYIALSDLDYIFDGVINIDEPLNMDYYCEKLRTLKRSIQKAQIVIPNIPQRFIPDEFSGLIPIIEQIELSDNPEKCFKEHLQDLFCGIIILKSSITQMATLFSGEYLRVVYEIDNKQVNY